jgi:hypothetical protein
MSKMINFHYFNFVCQSNIFSNLKSTLYNCFQNCITFILQHCDPGHLTSLDRPTMIYSVLQTNFAQFLQHSFVFQSPLFPLRRVTRRLAERMRAASSSRLRGDQILAHAGDSGLRFVQQIHLSHAVHGGTARALVSGTAVFNQPRVHRHGRIEALAVAEVQAQGGRGDCSILVHSLLHDAVAPQ